MTKEALENYKKFREENIKHWSNLLNNIFPFGIPESAVWTDKLAITYVLDALGEGAQTCHMFVPTGGGTDLAGAKEAFEEDCIEIKGGGGSEIVKPTKLIFQSFPNQPNNWAYFRLETDELEPISDYFYEGLSEGLTLRQDGVYEDVSLFDYYDEEEQPELIGCRRVVRYTKSAFVIFAKTSLYNNLKGKLDGYNGKHNEMNADQFKEYISKLLEKAVEMEMECSNFDITFTNVSKKED